MEQILITLFGLWMLTANDKIRLECDPRKTVAWGGLFLFKQCQHILIGYHSKKLL